MIRDSAKYDRQLRMWGEEAQRRLEHAHVCVIGASTVGAETLKCIALPGIGAFTLIDTATVSLEDCGTNFFVHGEQDLGRSRAQAVAEAISELNPDVKANYLDTMSDDDSFWSQFSVVIATQTSSEQNVSLSKRLRRLDVPLLIVKTYGMIGTFRVDAPDHIVLDFKAEYSVPDLRISSPFPELLNHAYCDNYAYIQSLDSVDHSHVPYVIILLQVLREWQRMHPNKDGSFTRLPETAKEQEELKNMVKALAKPGAFEENFEEAEKFVYLAWAKTELPDNIKTLFADRRCEEPTDDMWVTVSAIKQFVENEGHGMLPLQGSVPDMAALTNNYLALQRVYHDRAESDFSVVFHRAQAIKARTGSSVPVPESLVRQMCKNASSLTLMSYPPVYISPSSVPVSGESSDLIPEGDFKCGFSWALVFEAAEVFAKHHDGRWPGSYPANATQTEDLEADEKQLAMIVVDMLKARNYAEDTIKPEVVKEMFVSTIIMLLLLLSGQLCHFIFLSLFLFLFFLDRVRCGGCETHCTSTVMGALVGQEVVKLISHCYGPLDNCAVYNGFTCGITTYQIPTQSP